MSEAVGAEQRAHPRDQRVDVLLLVARRSIRRQSGGDIGRRASELPAAALFELRGDGAHVVAAVAVGWKCQHLALKLEIAHPGAGREDIHLPAAVVDVVLPPDLIADGTQQVR